MYSLAVVAWELLTGRCPFEGLSHLEVAIAVAQRGARLDLPEGCTAAQRGWMGQCWCDEPTSRPTAVETLRTLEQAFPVEGCR